jgi:DNA modification methylase
VIGSYESQRLKTEVAAEYNLSLDMVDEILRSADHEPINFEPKVYQLWNFGGRDTRYGQKHPGQLPAQMLQSLLYYYTRPGDVIVDLFGGGGVTLDVANDMLDRECHAFDIDPKRSDIQRHDLLRVTQTGFEVTLPAAVDGADLVFLDPPYWRQKRGEYSADATDFSNLSLDMFRECLASLVTQCLERIKPGGYTALIIGPTQQDWELFDHAAELMVAVGVPTHRIQVPYSTQQHGGNYVLNAKENRRWLYLNRDLMIWQRPTGISA